MYHCLSRFFAPLNMPCPVFASPSSLLLVCMSAAQGIEAEDRSISKSAFNTELAVGTLAGYYERNI